MRTSRNLEKMIINFYFIGKASVTPNGDATAFVQRSKPMSARREIRLNI